MSNWGKGSTRAWRKTRQLVLARDAMRCQLKLDGCTTLATCVHHLDGRGVSGDNPDRCVASCAHCNGVAGDPTTSTTDPPPTPRTHWG